MSDNKKIYKTSWKTISWSSTAIACKNKILQYAWVGKGVTSVKETLAFQFLKQASTYSEENILDNFEAIKYLNILKVSA